MQQLWHAPGLLFDRFCRVAFSRKKEEDGFMQKLHDQLEMSTAAKPAVPQLKSKLDRDEVLEEILRAAGLESLD